MDAVIPLSVSAAQHCTECGTAYPADARFCDHCGAVALLPEPAPLVAARPGAEALELVRALVRDKTRFEPEDLQQQSGADVQQPLTLSASYALATRLVSRDINGASFFGRSHDLRSHSRYAVESDALDDSGDRLRLAQAQLEAQLARDDTAYNGVGDGVYLGHARRHWHLDTCGACHGGGRVSCHTCYGRCRETCYQCHGAGRVSCTAWGCFGGQVNCSSCNGNGSTTHSESYTEAVNVSATTYHDGQYHTSYHTEYQTKYRDVSRHCSSCSYGKVQCMTCNGTSSVSCITCNAAGDITCRTCLGNGDLQCSPCAGSGQFGGAAWIDVDVAVTHALELPAGVADDVRRVASAAGPHGVVAIADALALRQVAVAPGLSGSVRADYQLLLRMVRLRVACNQHEYGLVAYGRPLAWLTLDDIVEDLLRQDLRALGQALARVADDGLLSADVEALLRPLQAVAASELNADVIESILDGAGVQAHVAVVSSDYAEEVRTAVLGALRHVYTRQAKRSWWHGALAAAGATVLVWLFTHLGWGLLAGLAVTAGSFQLFRRRMLELLTHALGGVGQADRAISLATRSQRQQRAYTLIVAPTLLSLAALAVLLPAHGWLSGAAAQAAGPVAPAPASPAERAEVDALLKRYAGGELAYARRALAPLALRGNPAAFGPYGWMLLLAEGLTPQEVQADGGPLARQHRAQSWIDQGLARGDVWAQAAEGALLLGNSDDEAGARKALAMLEATAGRGHGASMHYLASIYIQGFHVQRDAQAARKWYTQAAALNQPADLYNLGLMEWQGAGGARPDRAQAMALWRRAAALGEPTAIRAVQRGRPG